MAPFSTIVLDRIVSFIKAIGIEVSFHQLDDETFLPGIYIKNGKILVDRDSLSYPGDLLHEAGHLAVAPAVQRAKMTGNIEPDGNGAESLELAAICWSYAALTHLELDPKVVFHEGGYKGASEWFIENFTAGNYIGLPLLQWMGLCRGDGDTSGALPFPHMVRWLRK